MEILFIWRSDYRCSQLAQSISLIVMSHSWPQDYKLRLSTLHGLTWEGANGVAPFHMEHAVSVLFSKK